MRPRLSFAVFVLVLLTAAVPAFAGKAIPLKCNFDPLPPYASAYPVNVTHDGDPVYDNGVGRVECFFGVNGGMLNLITYQTGRTLSFNLDPVVAALADIPPRFSAEVDFSGVNYYGKFQSMGIGTTAQMHADLEFYVGRVTYELDYPALAVHRTGPYTWLITTNSLDWGGWNPGFQVSSQASLNIVRRRSQETFGIVDAPIRFEVTIK